MVVSFILQIVPPDSFAQAPATESVAWTASEWAAVVSASAAAVAAIVSMVAAGVSAWAVRETNNFNERQTTWKGAEKERVYYDAILVGPALQAVRHYRRAMGRALRTGVRGVSDVIERNASVSEHQAAVDGVLDSGFTDLLVKLRDELLEAAQDWNNGPLQERFLVELGRLEDEVTKEALKLLTVGAAVNFEAVVNNVFGDIVRLIMEFDPAVQATRNVEG